MSAAPFKEALSSLDLFGAQLASEKPLALLERPFEALRNQPAILAPFVEELVKGFFWQKMDYLDNPYKALCLSLSIQIDKGYDSLGKNEPPYHSRKHFQDVCLSLSLLLQRQSNIQGNLNGRSNWIASNEEAWILLFCAIGHDYGHDGSINQTPFEIEKESIQKLQDFLLASDIDLLLAKDLLSEIEPIILATDPSYFKTLSSKFIDPHLKPTKTECLSMLMVEADLLASTLPEYGKSLGKLLGLEWSIANPQAAEKVVSTAGRISFLEYVHFFSPHSLNLGMEDIRIQSIHDLKKGGGNG